MKQKIKDFFRKEIRRKVFAFAFRFGKSEIEQYVSFITDAPVWQWRKRLWLAKTTIGFCKPSELNEWLRFLDE